MAIVKTVLKKVYQQGVVKFVGDSTGGSANVDLGADLKTADETLDVANLKVNINTVYFNSNGAAPITLNRNGSNVQILYGSDNWLFSQQSGFVDTSNLTANIVVTIPAGGGTVILGLTKQEGFIQPDRQNLQPRQR